MICSSLFWIKPGTPDDKAKFEKINPSHYSHFLKPFHRNNTKALYSVRLNCLVTCLPVGILIYRITPWEESHNAGVPQKVQYGLIEWQSSSNFSMQEK